MAYNAGQSPTRVVLVDPTTDDDYVAGGSGATATQVQGNTAAGATDSGSPVKTGGVYSTAGTITAVAVGQRSDTQTDSFGSTRVLPVLNMGAPVDTAPNVGLPFSRASNSAAGAAPMGVAGYLWSGTAFNVSRKPVSVARLVSSAGTTNATVAKATAGDLFSIHGYNTNAAARYLKLYNKATAPTVGTDTPVMTIYLPPQSAFPPLNWPTPQYFSAGIGYAITTGAADADTGAVTAGDIVCLNVTYA